MGRCLRIGTTVLALTIPGAALATAQAAEPAVQIRFTTQPRVTFSEGLTSESGTKGALASVAWSVSRPADVTVRALDASGAVVRTLTEHVAVADQHDLEWTFVDAAGNDVPEGDYRLRVEAVDADGTRDVEDYAMPLDRHTVVPLQGVVSGTTYSTNATMSIGPRPGITPTSARFMVGDGYGDDSMCAVSEARTPGFGGRIQATFNVSDCGTYSGRAGAFFEFTDRIGARQQGYTPTIPVRVVDRVAPTAKLHLSDASQVLHLQRAGSYETTTTRFAVRDASAIASATYEVRNGIGALVATGDLTDEGALEADPLTHVFDLRWDGTRDNGALLPAARYRVTTRFTDSAGYRTTGPVVTVDLDATVPGTMTVSRIDGYRWQVVVTPKAGAGVTAVAVSTSPQGDADDTAQQATYDAATGTFRTVISLAGRPAGTYPVRALITRGAASTTFTTGDQELVLAEDTAGPVVTQPANSRLYLGLPDQYVAATFGFGVSDQSSVQSADFVATSADGTTLVDHTVAAGGEGRTSFTWDGTGPDGERLPGGDYVVRTTFTDARGNATPASVTVHLDDTVPGTIAVVATTGNAFTVELTPTAGVTVQAAGVALIGNSCCGAAMVRDQATGRYRVTVDLDSRPAGTYYLTSLVARDTPGSAAPYGYYWTAPVRVTVSH
jgi:flagellar hook assembly protein FlgD